MRNRKIVLSAICLSIVSMAVPSRADDSLSTMASTWVEKARHGAVVAQVKAALMDRKDIRTRYIRVRYDGRTRHLAGFVTDKKQGEQIAEIAQRQQEHAVLVTFWSYQNDLEDRDPYKTRMGEQASDAEIWAKVRASLFSPAAKGLLEHADVQAVDVRHGKVRVFLILDGPPEDLDITPYVKPIPGVKEVEVLKMKAYEPAVHLSQLRVSGRHIAASLRSFFRELW